MNYITETELATFQKKADEMKKSVLNTENMNPAEFKGIVYYLSADGNDRNDGKTPQTAFRTIERLKQVTLNPDDAILFRRGDFFRGNSLNLTSGVTVSTWGTGAKPTICGSLQNYADPQLWEKTEYEGIWKCTLPFKNVGLITFDHDPEEIGNYDVLCGWMVCPTVDFGDHSTYTFPDPPPLQLKNDLEFWTDSKTQTLYLRSDENPGMRFHEIEIAPEYHGLICRNQKDVTIDNLHVTMMGRHGISAGYVVNFEVKNCVIDYIGGSLLWEERLLAGKLLKNVRFGNAVEVFGECDGYRVSNNWIYQIYDTGITHQCNDCNDISITMQNVEYRDNLIEYCFWSIEYYNLRNLRSVTKNVHVHHNFCRFGGQGWGCKIRKQFTPMYSISFDAETENYVTEDNIFQFSAGNIIRLYGKNDDPNGFTFHRNTYIQAEGGIFANDSCGRKHSWKVLHAGMEPADYMKRTFGEEDGTFLRSNDSGMRKSIGKKHIRTERFGRTYT